MTNLFIEVNTDQVLKLYQDATDQNIKHFFNKINNDYYICELVFNNLISYFESNKTDFIQMIKDGVISLVNKEDLEDYTASYNNYTIEINDDLFLIIE